MKKFIITESEKNDIRKMYGLIKEQADVISQYVSDPRLQNILREIETTLGEKFTKEHFEKEIGLSGQIKNEAGGLLPEVEKAFEKMKNEAGCPRIAIRGDVSYRTYEFQKNQFLQYAKKTPKIDSAMVQASIPGFSAHHTGKAIDYYEDGASNYDCLIKNAWPNGDFNTPNKWGFTLPYMSGNIRKKEPWHLYYVGTTQQQSQSNQTQQTQQKTGTLSIEATSYDDLFKQIRDKTTGISINKDSIDLDFTSKTFSVDYGDEKIEKIYLIMGREYEDKVTKKTITKDESFETGVTTIRNKYYLEPIGESGTCQNCFKINDVERPVKYQLFIAKSVK